MRSRFSTVLLSLALLLPLSAVAQEQKKAPEPLTLKKGDVAPEFKLLHYDGQGVKPVSLSDFRGKKNVMVAFFVFAFTGG